MLASVRFLSLYAFSVLATVYAAIGPVGDLEIANAEIAPDGFNRVAVLAGGTFPGPVITGNKGDRFLVNVINQLTDIAMAKSTSIHWHGIFQRGSNYVDGAASVTQCPIATGDSFLYEFDVQDQAATQYCDGLRGAFVVYDSEDPHQDLYDIDDESTIITLADWYHQPSHTLIVPGQAPPEPLAILINGVGRYLGGPATPLAVVNVEPGKRYRFRLIAMSCDPAFTFSIDGHSLTIIEADGENTAPLEVDSLDIYAGQRYSVVLNADQPVDNYWIRANPNRGAAGFDDGLNSAILRYAGAPDSDPTTTSETENPLQEADLRSYNDETVPGEPRVGGADVNINLVTSVNSEGTKYQMNGVTFAPPTVPVLLQILSGAQSAQDLLPKGAVYELPPNKVIEISLPGTGVELGGPHPFHLHGHSFYVVRSGDNDVYNYQGVVKRDTVNAGLADGNATIRFVTDNAGPWFLHCHIDWHFELGLAVVFAEDIAGTDALKDKIPSAWDELCPKYDNLTPEEIGTE
ncbi:hypothetical protein H0H87_002335 [Tephrocybe sp. NHM501043]|nr:hypothetical protein H0H87_002335 [Tephrocybe sp. NHM501043]